MERQLGEFAPAQRQSAWPAPSERTSGPRHGVAPATDAAFVFAVNRPHGRVVHKVAPQRAEFPGCRLVGSGGLIDILPRFFRHAPFHSWLGRICSPWVSNLVSGPGCGSARLCSEAHRHLLSCLKLPRAICGGVGPLDRVAERVIANLPQTETLLSLRHLRIHEVGASIRARCEWFRASS
jgi:hypothetical protein